MFGKAESCQPMFLNNKVESFKLRRILIKWKLKVKVSFPRSKAKADAVVRTPYDAVFHLWLRFVSSWRSENVFEPCASRIRSRFDLATSKILERSRKSWSWFSSILRAFPSFSAVCTSTKGIFEVRFGLRLLVTVSFGFKRGSIVSKALSLRLQLSILNSYVEVIESAIN